MIIAIDSGNTRIKCAVFENTTIAEIFVFEHESFEKNFKKILKKFPSTDKILLSNVGKPVDFGFVEGNSAIEIVTFNSQTHFPFQNKYETPHTLGVDRMVLSSGATILYPNYNRLVIDAGTCITYDYINEENEYLGGAISPGFRLRYESLHNYTAKLPLLQLEPIDSFIGKTTNTSIHSGVIFGIISEIEGFIARYQSINKNFIIILTGGDAVFLANQLKNTIFANPNFLLESLLHTYLYTIKND